MKYPSLAREVVAQLRCQSRRVESFNLPRQNDRDGCIPGDWQRAESLASWLHQAIALEPTLSVRNLRLLMWSEAPASWAERLRAVSAKVIDATLDVASFVKLVNERITPAEKRVAWTLSELVTKSNGWSTGIERYNEWPPTRDGLRWLDSVTEGDFASRCYAGTVPAGEIADRVHLATYEQLWNPYKMVID